MIVLTKVFVCSRILDCYGKERLTVEGSDQLRRHRHVTIPPSKRHETDGGGMYEIHRRILYVYTRKKPNKMTEIKKSAARFIITPVIIHI